MIRREFIALAGRAAVAWPLAARAQRKAMQVIGYVGGGSRGLNAAAFHQGLSDGGYIEGQSVAIEYRWAEGHFDRLPALVADLVSRQVNVIAAGNLASAQAAKRATSMIPIVFVTGGDPVEHGLVASLNRPGGNITGISFLINGLAAKAVELLHELVPKAAIIGLLINPKDANAASDTTEAQAAADTFGLKSVLAKASTESEIESAFTTFVQQQVTALFVEPDSFFMDQRKRIVALAARHALPAVSQLRVFAEAGGLASYGTSITAANRQLGDYTGRVLKGAKPADLPVMQSTRFELIINLKAAKVLGLEVPWTLGARADEVIE
jgi:putative tryptophan/tyrosine transport system substrate-binding protein